MSTEKIMEAGTEGMEILRAVASAPIWPDNPDTEDWPTQMTFARLGLTPDHVRQARAIVAAAERKEVMPVEAAAPVRSTVDTAPPTAGPIPPAGAPAVPGFQPIRDTLACLKCAILSGEQWSDEMQASFDAARGALVALEGAVASANCALEIDAAPSPQPPAPADGGADVAGLVDKLAYYAGVLQEMGERNSACHYLDIAEAGRERLDWARNIKQAADALSAQAAALAAKEAECERLKSQISDRFAELATEQAKSDSYRDDYAKIKARCAELEAALRPFARLPTSPSANGCVEVNIDVAKIEIARAALSGKEPQQP